jgi:uncharacterized membrane protein
MTVENQVISAIEAQAWIDRAADPAQRAIRMVLDRTPGLERVLHGRFLGHPLHAALIPVPVGAWTIGVVLDLAEATTGTRRFQRTADLLTAVGLGGALIAATAGLADWSLTQGTTKRVGFIHGALNVAIAGVYGLSVLARARKARRTGIALAVTGHTALVFSAWLGGELAYRFGVGVAVRPEAPPPPAPAVRDQERIGVARLGT